MEILLIIFNSFAYFSFITLVFITCLDILVLIILKIAIISHIFVFNYMTAEKQKKSFDSFFKKEYNKLLNYVRKNIEEKFLNSSPEDIIQDVALSLLNKLDVDSQIENLAGYMYRSLKNKIIDEKRKAGNNFSVEYFERNQKVDAQVNSISDETYSENSYSPEINNELLYEALSQLKPDEQAIIISTEFENKTFGELSEKWNVPIGTLLSRKHRALAKLYNILTIEKNKQINKINDYGNERKLFGEKTLSL